MNGKLNNTFCNCVSPLVWKDGACICTDPTAVFLTNKCVACNSAILATDKNTFTTCNCIPPLIWNGTGCHCGPTSAYILLSNGSYQCVSCNNSAVFLKNRVNAAACACTVPALVWYGSTGTCDCVNAETSVFSNSNTACAVCSTSSLAVARTGFRSCSCVNASLTWSVKNSACECNSTSAYFFDAIAK
jgi:hypothetical protein